MNRLGKFLLLLLGAGARGFIASQSPSSSVFRRRQRSAVGSAKEPELVQEDALYDTPSECYLIYPSEDDTNLEEVPYMVCTNAPEDYAWFHGLEADWLIPADGTSTPLNALECQQTESSRGIPEWECQQRRRP